MARVKTFTALLWRCSNSCLIGFEVCISWHDCPRFGRLSRRLVLRWRSAIGGKSAASIFDIGDWRKIFFHNTLQWRALNANTHRDSALPLLRLSCGFETSTDLVKVFALRYLFLRLLHQLILFERSSNVCPVLHCFQHSLVESVDVCKAFGFFLVLFLLGQLAIHNPVLELDSQSWPNPHRWHLLNVDTFLQLAHHHRLKSFHFFFILLS